MSGVDARGHGPRDGEPDWIQRDLELAVQAAREAGLRALAIRAAGRWEGDVLADVGDNACDGYVQGLLRGCRPEDGILSEETADTTGRLERERAWIVDPLDGTREYSQGRDDWAVHVALTVDGRCALGAVALPAKERLLWGVCLAGHERFGAEGAGDLLAGGTSSSVPPRLAVSRSHTPPWVQRFASDLEAEMTPAGSVGNKVAMLLLGEADVYVHQRGLKEWDTCAPEAVARSLGWHVSKLRGESHTYNRPDPRNHELVICRPEWKQRVLEAVARSGAL